MLGQRADVAEGSVDAGERADETQEAEDPQDPEAAARGDQRNEIDPVARR